MSASEATSVLIQNNLVPALFVLIFAIGAALLLLIGWIARRAQAQIDSMPQKVAEQINSLHEPLVLDVAEIKSSLARLEKDLRGDIVNLDRRVTRVETIQDMSGQKLYTHRRAGQ